MQLSSHQPNFIPWIGYFYKIALSDVFVVADDVDFTRKSYINRNLIKTPAGVRWVTIPVKKMPLGTPINKIEINALTELEKILKLVKSNYARAPYFDFFYEKFEHTILSHGNYLSEVNFALIKLIVKELKIETQIFKTSELTDIKEGSTNRIISICKLFGADIYISGFGGQKYQSEDLMRANGITCQVYKFRHPEYNQLWGPFVPNMSVIDLLFNYGPSAGNIVKNN